MREHAPDNIRTRLPTTFAVLILQMAPQGSALRGRACGAV